MKKFRVYYHFNRGERMEGYVYATEVRAVDKFQAMAIVQKWYKYELSFSIIKVREIEIHYV